MRSFSSAHFPIPLCRITVFYRLDWRLRGDLSVSHVAQYVLRCYRDRAALQPVSRYVSESAQHVLRSVTDAQLPPYPPIQPVKYRYLIKWEEKRREASHFILHRNHTGNLVHALLSSPLPLPKPDSPSSTSTSPPEMTRARRRDAVLM